jgi:ribosomal protein S18 acetylase RimI-like enzyme
MTSAPPNAEIRPVHTVDAPTVRTVILDMLRESPLAFGESLADAEARSEEEWSALVEHLITPGIRAAFLASDEDGACGFVCADSDLPQAGPDTIVISRVWVAPRQRGSGLGKRLMSAATEWAQGKNAALLGLGVTEMNTNAMRFYEHLGYKDTGMRFAWPPDPTKQIIVLGRRLRT